MNVCATELLDVCGCGSCSASGSGVSCLAAAFLVVDAVHDRVDERDQVVDSVAERALGDAEGVEDGAEGVLASPAFPLGAFLR